MSNLIFIKDVETERLYLVLKEKNEDAWNDTVDVIDDTKAKYPGEWTVEDIIERLPDNVEILFNSAEEEENELYI